MRAIFISYRREDAEGQAGRLFDDLVNDFGEDAVFMDVAGIAPGRDFRKAIDEQVSSCGVLLAVIGKNWLDAKDEHGTRRLDDPLDFVLLETASALKRDIPVIPVLVRGAVMPRAEELPADLGELAYRNAVELTHARWESDVQVLIKALRPHIEVLKKDVGSTPDKLVDDSTAGTKELQGITPEDDKKDPWPKKKKFTVIIAVLFSLIIVLVIGYFINRNNSDKKRQEIVNDASLLVTDSTNNTLKKADSTIEVISPSVTGKDTSAKTKPKEDVPALPTSYTLSGTWQDDEGKVFATVAGKEEGEFEMEQVKPPKEYDVLWKAILKGRSVEIDVFAMPSGSHQSHMNLTLSLDGNRMAGLENVVLDLPENVPPSPVHFKRLK